MKLNKLYAGLISGAMGLSLITTALPSSQTLQDNCFLKTFESLSLKAEPITASAASSLRRPCSSQAPMWIVHIETWNHADPQKIIDLIPEDIRPYVVFNISMSIYWSQDNHEWGMVQDGYELAKSWLRTCADEGIWCMVQPASG